MEKENIWQCACGAETKMLFNGERPVCASCLLSLLEEERRQEGYPNEEQFCAEYSPSMQQYRIDTLRKAFTRNVQSTVFDRSSDFVIFRIGTLGQCRNAVIGIIGFKEEQYRQIEAMLNKIEESENPIE
jgi:hypothetical protein